MTDIKTGYTALSRGVVPASDNLLLRIPLLPESYTPTNMTTSLTSLTPTTQINPRVLVDQLGYTGNYSLRILAGVRTLVSVSSTIYLVVGIYNYRDSSVISGGGMRFTGTDVGVQTVLLSDPIIDQQNGSTYRPFYYGSVSETPNTRWCITFVDVLLYGEI